MYSLQNQDTTRVGYYGCYLKKISLLGFAIYSFGSSPSHRLAPQACLGSFRQLETLTSACCIAVESLSKVKQCFPEIKSGIFWNLLILMDFRNNIIVQGTVSSKTDLTSIVLIEKSFSSYHGSSLHCVQTYRPGHLSPQ